MYKNSNCNMGVYRYECILNTSIWKYECMEIQVFGIRVNVILLYFKWDFMWRWTWTVCEPQWRASCSLALNSAIYVMVYKVIDICLQVELPANAHILVTPTSCRIISKIFIKNNSNKRCFFTICSRFESHPVLSIVCYHSNTTLFFPAAFNRK